MKKPRSEPLPPLLYVKQKDIPKKIGLLFPWVALLMLAAMIVPIAAAIALCDGRL